MVHFTDPRGESDGESDDGLAPVIPLFGDQTTTAAPDARVRHRAAPPTSGVADGHSWHSTWDDDSSDDDAYGEQGVDECGAIEREIAEKNLLKKLRMRSLSVREARVVVAERDLDAAAIDAVLADFLRRGYLDDAALAEQLIHAGVDRKGQGRQVIAQTLAKRGIARDIADAALAALPDDDAERALDYARSKAAGLSRLDRDTAVRRLVGQLSRRGYPGSVAMTAARAALDEAVTGSSGVRFR